MIRCWTLGMPGDNVAAMRLSTITFLVTLATITLVVLVLAA